MWADASIGTKILIVVAIIAVVVVAALIVYFLIHRSRMKNDPVYADRVNRNKAYKDTIRPAKEKVKRAQKDYDNRLQIKADAIKAAENDRQRAIKAQEKEIKGIEEQFAALVTAFAGVKLYRDRVEYKNTLKRLNTQMRARVMSGREFLEAADAAVDSARAAGTSVNTTELVNETATQSTADAYLIIHDGEDPTAIDIKLAIDERDVSDAQSFANTFNLTANDSDNVRSAKLAQIDAAKAKLEEIKADTRAIDAAKEAYEAETKVRGELDRAQQEFDAIEFEARKTRDGIQ